MPAFRVAGVTPIDGVTVSQLAPAGLGFTEGAAPKLIWLPLLVSETFCCNVLLEPPARCH